MTRRKRLLAAAAVAGAALAVTAAGSAVTTADESSRGGQNFFREDLSGYDEIPVVSSASSGQFRGSINSRDQVIEYRLSYADLSAPITQAHIHLGSATHNGGISVFLCTNLANGPAGTQLCPEAPATISGTITAADVIGPTTQGIAAGEFGELINAARVGLTYVNVHSQMFPAGEIRAQLGHSGH